MGVARASILEARSVSRRFGERWALRDVSLELQAGKIHALLGPNGAGKTTFIRIFSGLLGSTAGQVRVLGQEVGAGSRELRQHLGLVPSGDRSFYLRLSGLENLVFFARLHGMRRKAAVARAEVILEQVGLAEAAQIPVGTYSHGMQKRLSVGRALLTGPLLLLVDEATHDLDPRGAHEARELVRDLAAGGTAVIWATQRLDEIRGFADGVTLLDRGEVRFSGTVPELMAHAVPRRYLLRVRNGQPDGAGLQSRLEAILQGMAVVAAPADDDAEHYLVTLAPDVVLGEAVASLRDARIDVLACREERPEIEEAFLSLTGGHDS